MHDHEQKSEGDCRAGEAHGRITFTTRRPTHRLADRWSYRHAVIVPRVDAEGN